MELLCPICGAFAVDDALVPAEGGRFACPSCGASVEARWPALEIDLDEPAPPTPARRGASAPAAANVAPPASNGAAPELDLRLDVDRAAPRAGGFDGVPVRVPVPEASGAQPQELSLELEGPPAGSASPESEPGSAPPPARAARKAPSDASHAARAASMLPKPLRDTPAASGARERAVVATGSSPGDAPDGDSAPKRRPVRPVRATVMITSPRGAAWRVYALLAGTAAAAALLVLGISALLRKPPPPPRMPNPLREQVAAWEKAGVVASVSTPEEGVRLARTDLATGSDRDLGRALDAARSALLLDVDSPAAIAAYALALARAPDRVEPELLDATLGAITSAVGRDPDGPLRGELEDARAWLLIRSGRFERAREAASRALEIMPGSLDAKLASAAALIRSAPEEAVAQLDELAKGPEKSATVSSWLGEALLRSGAARRALQVWNDSLAGGPADAAVLRRLAMLAAASGDFAAALAHLRRIADAGWACVEDRLLLARLEARVAGEPQEALHQLDLALSSAGISPVSHARVIAEKVAVVTARRLGTVTEEEISRLLDQGLDLAPDLPELLYVAGLADERAGHSERAVESLEAAVDLAPAQPEPALRLALLLRHQDPSGARQVIATAVREAPSYVPLYLLQALLELDAGNRVAAAAMIRRATDYDPQRYRSATRLGAFVDPGAAHARIARALAEHTRGAANAMLSSAAGMAYWWAGESGRARGQLARAVRLDPHEVGARLYRAVMELDRGRLAVARREIAAALAADSQHSVARFYQARLLERSGKASQAESIYRDLLDKNPLDGGARIGLARVLAAGGHDAEARAEALQVLSLRPQHGETLRFLMGDARREPKRSRPRKPR